MNKKPGQKNNKLNGNLGFIINVTARWMRIALEDALKEYNISPTQWLVLQGLYECEQATQSDLSKLISLDNATVTRQIDKLENDGLMARKRDPEDRRAHIVKLTAKGKRLLPKLEKISSDINSIAVKGLKKTEVKNLLTTLDHIKTNVGNNNS